MTESSRDTFNELVSALYQSFSAAASIPAANERREDSLEDMAIDIEQRVRNADVVEANDIWSGVISGSWTMIGVSETPDRQYVIARKNVGDPGGGRGLSGREVQVVAMVVRGHANKYIAIELGLTESTVATHLRRAMSC